MVLTYDDLPANIYRDTEQAVAGITRDLVGGLTPNARNIISGNLSNGVSLREGTSNTTVVGNYIGTDVTGTVALGNSYRGILVTHSPNNTIGGTNTGERNVISGNGWDGIALYEVGTILNQVLGNYIGTDYTGTVDLGNLRNGVLQFGGSTNNPIGGTSPAARNVESKSRPVLINTGYSPLNS